MITPESLPALTLNMPIDLLIYSSIHLCRSYLYNFSVLRLPCPFIYEFSICVSFLTYQFLISSLIWLSCNHWSLSIDHFNLWLSLIIHLHAVSVCTYHYLSVLVCPSLSICCYLCSIFLSLSTSQYLSVCLAGCLSIGLSVWRSICLTSCLLFLSHSLSFFLKLLLNSHEEILAVCAVRLL